MEKELEPINLDPRYSTCNVTGRCIRCLAEERLNDCLLELLQTEGDDADLVRRFEALLDFLKSPESQKLHEESERYLAEGKRVRVSIRFVDDKPTYELKVEWQ